MCAKPGPFQPHKIKSVISVSATEFLLEHDEDPTKNITVFFRYDDVSGQIAWDGLNESAQTILETKFSFCLPQYPGVALRAFVIDLKHQTEGFRPVEEIKQNLSKACEVKTADPA